MGVEGERATASGARQAGDDQRVCFERRGGADVPALDLESEPGEEVADVGDAAPGLLREVLRLLRLALGAERDEVPEELFQVCRSTP